MSGGAGGNGGGGAGSQSSNIGTAGTDNRGGGGGGGCRYASDAGSGGGNGGSGVVIVRYLTSEAGGYTITGGTKVVGPAGAADYTVHSFTSTGTFSLVIA